MENQKIIIFERSSLFAELFNQKIPKDFNAKIISSSNEMYELDYKQIDFIIISIDTQEDKAIIDFVIEKEVRVLILSSLQSEELHKYFSHSNVIDYVIKHGKKDILHALSSLQRIQKNSSIEVLIVDDSSFSRATIKNTIAKQGFTIYEAEDGKEALEILDVHPNIKIIFSDYYMPVMDGFAFVKALRQRFNKEQNSVIVISADQDLSTTAKFLKNGANDFIKKPFSGEELLARMYQNLEILELIGEIKELSQYNIDEQTRGHAKQKSIITNDLKDNNSCKIDVIYKPSDIMSGDLYSVHEKPDGTTVFYILDGMGHGIQPSLTVFAATSILKYSIMTSKGLQETINKFLENIRVILATNEQLSYTIFCISPDRKSLRYVNGGMYPSFLLENSGNIITLKANSLPITAWTKSIASQEIFTQPISSIIAYSDGIVEEDFSSFNGDAKELLMNDEILRQLKKEISSKKTYDDTTLLRIKYNY